MPTRENTEPHVPSDQGAPPMTGDVIRGYRTLGVREISMMNDVKEMEALVAELWARFMADKTTDSRWMAIAKTQLELGFMAFSRAIAKPKEWDMKVDPPPHQPGR